MGNLRAPFVFAIVIAPLAACGNDHASGSVDAPRSIDAVSVDAKIFMDAPPPTFDFTCVGNTAPTVDANVTVAGIVTEASANGITPTSMPLQGASLDLCKNGAANCMGGNKYGSTATSDAAGAFSIGPVTTGGTALDAYLALTNTGDEPVFLYPAAPIAASLAMVPVLTLKSTLVAELETFGLQHAGNGIVGIVVVDCANNPITDTAHLVPSIEQGGTPTSSSIYDASMYDPTAAGSFIAFDIPPGATTIGATYNGVTPPVTLMAHVVTVVADSATETLVRPGY